MRVLVKRGIILRRRMCSALCGHSKGDLLLQGMPVSESLSCSTWLIVSRFSTSSQSIEGYIVRSLSSFLEVTANCRIRRLSHVTSLGKINETCTPRVLSNGDKIPDPKSSQPIGQAFKKVQCGVSVKSSPFHIAACRLTTQRANRLFRYDRDQGAYAWWIARKVLIREIKKVIESKLGGERTGLIASSAN
jgi:hypothetical protein